MKSILTAALAVLSLGVASTEAADKPDVVINAKPQDVAKAKAHADAIIKAADAGDLFENLTTSSVAVVRHKASGLRCDFDGNPADKILLFPNPVRGDDVGCGSRMLEMSVTLYATRLTEPMDLDTVTQVSMQAIRKTHPELQPYKRQAADMSRDDLPPVRTVRFVLKASGKDLYSRLSVSVVNGWTVSERVTGPLDKAMEGDVVGGMLMIEAVDSVRGGEPNNKKE